MCHVNVNVSDGGKLWEGDMGTPCAVYAIFYKSKSTLRDKTY